MELTGKCKEEFHKWCLSDIDKFDMVLGTLSVCVGILSIPFCKLPYSMKYGVYVDFFLSETIIIDCQPLLDYDEHSYNEVICWYSIVNVLLRKFNEEDVDNNQYKTLSEARSASIIKANELFNQTIE